MSKILLTTDTDLTAVADAIRAKNETSKPLIYPDDYIIGIRNASAVSVDGDSSISVSDAVSGEVCSLTQYGVCEQDSSTNAISCNNGTLSISNGDIATTAENSETITLGSQTATVENLYSVGNVRDEQEITTGRIVRRNNVCIYDGTQAVSDRYLSSTGAKDNGAIIVYPMETEYTDPSVASFTEENSREVNLLEASITPIQSLNGYSNPWPGGGGKNLWDTKPYKGLSYNIAVGTTVSLTDGAAVNVNENEISFAANSWGYRNFKTKSLSAGTYRVYLNISEITSPAISVYNVGSDNVIKKVDNYRSGTTISTSRTITDGDYIIVYVSSDTAQTIKITDYQIEAGSSHTDWEPFENICPISGRTGLNVYRTGFNLCQDSVHINHYWESGVLKTNKNANYAAIDIKVPVVPGEDYCVYVPDNTSGGRVYVSFFDANESVIKQENYTIGSTNVFTTTADTRFVAISFYKSGGVLVGERICVSLSGPNDGTYEPYQGTTCSVDWSTQAGTVYGGSLDVVTGVLTVDRADIASYNGEVINEPWLSSMDAYVAGETPTTGAQVVYTLATPLTYQLTSQEVETLAGINNVFSSDGTSIKVAISNPVVEHVTPQPLNLSSGNNTLTASNLSVSSVLLRMAYNKSGAILKMGALRPDAELVKTWSHDSLFVTDDEGAIPAYTTTATTLTASASLETTYTVDLANYDYFVLIRGLTIPFYNTSTPAKGRNEYAVMSAAYELVNYPASTFTSLVGDKTYSSDFPLVTTAYAAYCLLYWSSGSAVKLMNGTSYGVAQTVAAPSISGSTLTVQSPALKIRGSTTYLTSTVWGTMTDIRWQYIIELYRAPKSNMNIDGWGLVQQGLHVVDCAESNTHKLA